MAFHSDRRRDSELNKIVNEYLDKFIYPQIPIFNNIERHEDKYTQLKGIDVIFKIGDNYIKCDEKSAVKWAGKDRNGHPKLTTFTLEISNKISDGSIVDGWFINPSLETEYYMFIWLPEVKNNVFNDISDIIQIDLAFVKKDDIKTWLAQRGWTTEKLHKKADKIRFENDRDFGPVDGVAFTYSERLWEQPINIKLAKYTYKTLATAFYSFKNGVMQPNSFSHI